MNVCGLLTRLHEADFQEFVTKFDILAFQETRTDQADTDIIKEILSGIDFDCFLNNRKTLSTFRSGGTALCVKHNIRHLVTPLYQDDYSQWFHIKQGLFINTDCILVNAYVPPETSRYSNSEIFDNFEQELISRSRMRTPFLFVGDFNAYTSNISEIDSFDVDDDDTTRLNIDEIENRVALEGLPKRATKDRHNPNNFGRRLLLMCKNFNLVIVNGRYGRDKGIGSLTCKLGSVVDYAIASIPILKQIVDFGVEVFDSLFSDVHSALTLSIMSKGNAGIIQKTIDNASYEEANHNIDPRLRFKWDRARSREFVENIDNDDFQDVLKQVQGQTLHVNTERVVEFLSKTFISAATKTFGKPRKPHANHRNKQLKRKLKNNFEWFNLECKRLQHDYRRCKLRYSRTKSNVDYVHFINACRKYKRCINKAKRNYHVVTAERLRNFSSKDPKSFWSILNGKKNSSASATPTLEELSEHFKDINVASDENMVDFPTPENYNNAELDREISKEEIETAVKKLKTGKACGVDSITNEYIKSTLDIFMPVYLRIFNNILETGVLPDTWLHGIIVPIYKGKGDQKEPANYRGLTILSCLGKLFTSILNKRLYIFCEANRIILPNQAGFRSDFSVLDHCYALKGLINLCFSQKKRLYCLMVDFKRAFDCIDRAALWLKLLNNGISGRCLTVIKNMYSNVKSCVSLNGCVSKVFNSDMGVRQGEILSPLLFALFVNDLESFLARLGSQPIEVNCDMPEIDNLIKILVLLYADDTVIVAESPEQLQNAINALDAYCQQWKLQVNVNKTKVIIFSKRKLRQNQTFTLNGTVLEVVENFKYLGLIFQRNGTFKEHRKYICNQARKAMYGVLRRGRELSLPIDVMLKLFHTMVEPILLYASEVWGTEDIGQIETFHLKFLKYVLKLRANTPSCMVYGETGEFPLSLRVQIRMVHFWCKIVTGRHDKYTFLIYKCLLQRFNEGSYISPWLSKVKEILDSTGNTFVWINQATINFNPTWLSEIVKRTLKDQFIQKWFTDINNTPKCLTYRICKEKFGFEEYLNQLNWHIICKFRTCNHKLPIETGRHIGLHRRERLCTFCNTSVGDEFHIALECPALKELRDNILPLRYCSRPNIVKFKELFFKHNLKKLAKFLFACRKHYKLL